MVGDALTNVFISKFKMSGYVIHKNGYKVSTLLTLHFILSTWRTHLCGWEMNGW